MIQSKHLSKITILIILLATIWFQFFAKRWNQEKVIEWDVISYYTYLPATFIYKDITLEFTKADKAKFSKWFWMSFNEEGKHVVKMTMGMSILYSPFFAIAHFMAEPLGYEPSGYSIPYRFAISIGALFYLMLGLIMLRKLLLRHFSDTATAVTLILVTLGTNLTWYASIEPGMSHVYSFTLFVVFIYLLEKWLERATITNTILLGALSGLISLVRPTNAAIGVLFLLWGISNRLELKERLKLLYARWPYIYTMVAVAICIWIPQMLYWKMQTGHFLHHSYGQEGFFFFSPNITDGLFSFRKGWLLYTPTMAFALLGLLLLPKYSKGRTISIAAFTLINIYIIFSWWCWWYGGSFGARAFIESYALLSFPLAALVQWTLSKRIYIKIASMLFFTLLLAHSIFQTFQYYYGAIHWDSMTKGAYCSSLLSVKPKASFYALIDRPDYNSALYGKPEVKSIAQLIPEAEDIYIAEKLVATQAGTEYREVFNGNLTSIPNDNLVKVIITPSPEAPLPKDLLFSILVNNTNDESLFYADFKLSNYVFDKETPIKWERSINISSVESSSLYKIKIFFWSPKKESFSINEVKVMLCQMKPQLIK
jgi:hypothetical protein